MVEDLVQSSDDTAVAIAAKTPPVAMPPFERLFAEHKSNVWRALGNLGVPEADVQDACQEVFVVVHRKLPEFRGQSSHKTWIYGICLRVAAGRRRRAHHRREMPMAEVPDVAGGSDPESEVELRRARQRLDGILAGLAEAKREVFVLYEIEGLTVAEIAETLGCPLRTVYSRLETARQDVLHAWSRTNARGRAQ